MSYTRWPTQGCKQTFVPFDVIQDHGAKGSLGPMPKTAPFDKSVFIGNVRRGDPRTRKLPQRRPSHALNRLHTMRPAAPFDGSPFENIVRRTQNYHQVRMDPLSMEEYTAVANQDNLKQQKAMLASIHSGLTFLPGILKKIELHEAKVKMGEAPRGSKPDFTPGELAYLRMIGNMTPDQLMQRLQELEQMQIQLSTQAQADATADESAATADSSAIDTTAGQPTGEVTPEGGEITTGPEISDEEEQKMADIENVATTFVDQAIADAVSNVAATLTDAETRLLQEEMDADRDGIIDDIVNELIGKVAAGAVDEEEVKEVATSVAAKESKIKSFQVFLEQAVIEITRDLLQRQVITMEDVDAQKPFVDGSLNEIVDRVAGTIDEGTTLDELRETANIYASDVMERMVGRVRSGDTSTPGAETVEEPVGGTDIEETLKEYLSALPEKVWFRDDGRGGFKGGGPVRVGRMEGQKQYYAVTKKIVDERVKAAGARNRPEVLSPLKTALEGIRYNTAIFQKNDSRKMRAGGWSGLFRGGGRVTEGTLYIPLDKSGKIFSWNA